MRLHFDRVDAQQGTPLVILHGLFGSSSNWRSIAKKCAEHRPVYTLDLRNHGRSDWHDEMNYPAIAEDVMIFMQQQGVVSAHVLGHSMGGKAAMVLALTRPEYVASIAAVDIAPVVYEPVLIQFIEAMRSVNLTDMESRSEINAVLAPEIPHEGVRAFLLQNLKMVDGHYQWRLNLDILAQQIDNISGFPELTGQQYAGPSLFVYGEQSDYVLPEYEPIIREYFPAAELSRIEQAGHWLHAEQPVKLLKVLHRFLDGR